MFEVLEELESRCPVPVLHGRRIVRLTERAIGSFHLDNQALFELGTENVGVLIGGTDTNDHFMDRLREIRDLHLDGVIVIATSTKKLADWCYARLAGAASSRRRPDVFQVGAIILTTLERLHNIEPNDCKARPVLAVVLFDPICIVHLARGGDGYGWVSNDRPQLLVKFRYEHRKGEWQPPMLLMTTKRAKSLNTIHMLAPYGLEAWWFINANSLRTVPPPDED